VELEKHILTKTGPKLAQEKSSPQTRKKDIETEVVSILYLTNIIKKLLHSHHTCDFLFPPPFPLIDPNGFLTSFPKTPSAGIATYNPSPSLLSLL